MATETFVVSKETSPRAERRSLSIILSISLSISLKLPLRHCLPAHLFHPQLAVSAFNPSSLSCMRITFVAPIPSLCFLPTSHHEPYHLPSQPRRYRQGLQTSNLQQLAPPLYHRCRQHRLPMSKACIRTRSPTRRDQVSLAHQDAPGQLPTNRPVS